MRRQKHIFMLLKQALKSVKTITVQEDRNRFYVSKTGLEVCKKNNYLTGRQKQILRF